MTKLITGLVVAVLAALSTAAPAAADPTQQPSPPYVIHTPGESGGRGFADIAAGLRGTAAGVLRHLGSKFGNLGLPVGNLSASADV